MSLKFCKNLGKSDFKRSRKKVIDYIRICGCVCVCVKGSPNEPYLTA